MVELCDHSCFIFKRFSTGFVLLSTHLAARDVLRGEKRRPPDGVPDRLFLPVTLEGCLRPELGVARGLNILKRVR